MTDSERRLILLDPANPLEFDQAELDDLAREIEAEVPDIEVSPALRDEEGYGGPLNEVLYIWLTYASVVNTIDPLWKTVEITRAAVRWMQARWHRDHEEHGDRVRTRTLVVCDANGRVIETVRIDLPEGEAISEENPHPEVPHGRPPATGS